MAITCAASASWAARVAPGQRRSANDGADDPGHELGRASRGRRREARQGIDEVEHVADRRGPRAGRRGAARSRRSTSPRRRRPRSSSRGCRRGTSPTARSNRRTKTRNVRSHSWSASSSGSSGCVRSSDVGLRAGALQQADDRVALARLALRDNAPEPAPVVADRLVRDARRPAPADPPRLRDAFHQAPRDRLREREARRAMRQAERLADLALRQRRLPGQEVRLDSRDRRRDAPRGAHLAPGVGKADRIASADESARRAGRTTDSALVTAVRVPRARTCHLTLAHFWRRNVLFERSLIKEGPECSSARMFIGRLAGATQIVFAVHPRRRGVPPLRAECRLARHGHRRPSFALPGVVGLVGRAARRPALLLAAALTSGVGSFIAFSGVTLIFLAPALMFLASASMLGLSAIPLDAGAWLGGLARLGIASAIVALLLWRRCHRALRDRLGVLERLRRRLGVRVDVDALCHGAVEIVPGASSTECATGLISPGRCRSRLHCFAVRSRLGLAVVAARFDGEPRCEA